MPELQKFLSDSWGNVVRPAQSVHCWYFKDGAFPDHPRILPVGMRRSYGDVCTNDKGVVLDTTRLSRFISFDRNAGRLCCEAGVTLWEILQVTVPQGWFLPVTPGTSFVTLGGAVANDVHGKNHHVAGSFGCYVRRFQLRRTDGTTMICSGDHNKDLFAASLGGLGLTGVITWVELNLKRIESTHLDVESIEYAGFEEFLALSRESHQSHEYHVSWVDCLGPAGSTGRGVFFRANHQSDADSRDRTLTRSRTVLPAFTGLGPSLINPLTLRAFNTLYLRRHHGTRKYEETVEKYFYPLDAIVGWNNIYGRRGFYQFQCVVPFNQASSIIELLKRIEKSGQGSFLSVLKTMGTISSPGMLAFARPGVTLALDFPNRGARTMRLLKTLEQIVVEAGGAIYPAKDAVMSAATFRAGYPLIESFAELMDPGIASDFWRRVYQHGE